MTTVVAQVISDPSGNNLFAIGTAPNDSVSAQYLAVNPQGSASAGGSGAAVSGTGPASCGSVTVSVTGGASCSVGNAAVISGTGNATSASSYLTASGTGNASNATDHYYGTGDVAISGTGCASGGFDLTLVASGSCDADSTSWPNVDNQGPYDGAMAINLGHGCAQGGELVNLAMWGCANGGYLWPYFGELSVSLFGPAYGSIYDVSGTGNAGGTNQDGFGNPAPVCPAGASAAVSVTGQASTCRTSGDPVGEDVAIGTAGASGSTALAGTGSASSDGPMSLSAAGTASGGTVALSLGGSGQSGGVLTYGATGASGGTGPSGGFAAITPLGNATASELAIAPTGSAYACGGPAPLAVAPLGLINAATVGTCQGNLLPPPLSNVAAAG
ncbi:MAG TPA: hypothetical protein VFC09_16545 [Candidatus Dormibacteraeota bacterium]|nr:hypothetical protein [Candidatus Dormibacteraeota bacterium]